MLKVAAWKTPERIAIVCEMWADGATTLAIARRVGQSKNAIVGCVHRMHLPPRPSPLRPNRWQTDEKLAALRAGHEAGKTVQVMASEMHIPVRDLARALARMLAPPRPPRAAPRRDPPPIALPPIPLPPLSAAPPCAPAPPPPSYVFRPGNCLWPIETHSRPRFRECGEATEGRQVYCPNHCAKAYVRQGNAEMISASGFQ